jgi:hypothetical protein
MVIDGSRKSEGSAMPPLCGSDMDRRRFREMYKTVTAQVARGSTCWVASGKLVVAAKLTVTT